MFDRSILVALVTCSLAMSPSHAQSLELDATGGSMPGVMHFDVYPGLFAGELVLVIPSTSPGPTPLWLIDPLDPRSLDVGIDLLSLMWPGLTAPDGHLHIYTPLGSAPSLQDLPLFLQAVTLQWTPTIVSRISNPNVIRLGNAGAFRDRFVFNALPRVFATVLPRLDRSYMLVGGANGQLLAQIATNTTEIYDPVTDTFSLGQPLTTPRSMHTATKLVDGRWLLAGGVDGNNDPQASCEIYDPVLDLFVAVAPMTSPRMGHTATLLPNGKVFVTGGLEAMTVTPTQLQAIRDATNKTELYDPLTDTWTAAPNMNTPRAGHAAILRPDGKVLLAGGISWDAVIIIGWLPAIRSSCQLYDPVTNTFAAAPSMATPRSLVDAIDLGNNRWLLAGGISSLSLTNPGTPTAAAEIYDAVANTWTSVGAMATARGNHKGWAVGNGQFLLSGGANGTILSPTALASTEVFSTTTNAFSPGPPLNYARAAAAWIDTPQGQVFFGGGSTSGGSVTQSTEWYFR